VLKELPVATSTSRNLPVAADRVVDVGLPAYDAMVRAPLPRAVTSSPAVESDAAALPLGVDEAALLDAVAPVGGAGGAGSVDCGLGVGVGVECGVTKV